MASCWPGSGRKPLCKCSKGQLNCGAESTFLLSRLSHTAEGILCARCVPRCPGCWTSIHSFLQAKVSSIQRAHLGRVCPSSQSCTPRVPLCIRSMLWQKIQRLSVNRPSTTLRRVPRRPRRHCDIAGEWSVQREPRDRRRREWQREGGDLHL